MMNLQTNKDILQGEWKQLEGAVLKQWGKLTNDDLKVAQGNWETMVGQLQSSYGYTRADAETRLDAFVNHWNVNVRKPSADALQNTQNGMKQTIESAKSTVNDAVEQVQSSVNEKVEQVQQSVSHAAQQTQQTASQTAQQVQDAAVNAGTTVDTKVKRNRWKFLLFTLLAGVGIGYWLSSQ